jgi:hypothetical protein
MIYFWWLDRNNNKDIETIVKWLANLSVDIVYYNNHLHKDM